MEKTTAVFYRTLGRSGIRVSALGLGCAATGGQFYSAEGEPLAWVDVDDNESIRAIHAALAEGISFFDTADMYGAGHSEEVLGQALKGRRDRVVIATKFGDVMDPVTRRAMGFDARLEFIRQSLEASLRRLNTDYVDLYQFHIWGYPADEAVPVRETLEELAKEGKIRGYAWSTDVLKSLEVFAEGPNCIAIQHELNLFRCDEAILALCCANARTWLASIAVLWQWES